MIAMASHEWQNRLDAGWAEAKLCSREFGRPSFDPIEFYER